MQKRLFCILIFILAITTTYAQPWTPPQLPQTGQSVDDFVPKGYTVIGKATGNLNNDSFPDIAFIIQAIDTFDDDIALIDGTNKMRTNPRILVVVQQRGTLYKLLLQQNTFILRNGEGGWNPDPNARIEVDNNELRISFSMGHTGTTYIFKYLKDAFYQVAVNIQTTMGGSFDVWDFDFITGQAANSTGGVEENAHASESETKPIPKNELKKLSNILHPFMWEIFPDVFI